MPQLMSVILGTLKSSGRVNRDVFWDKENKSSIFSLWENYWENVIFEEKFGEKPNQTFNGC